MFGGDEGGISETGRLYHMGPVDSGSTLSEEEGGFVNPDVSPRPFFNANASTSTHCSERPESGAILSDQIDL